MEKLSNDIISRKIASYLSPENFNIFSSVSKNIYLLELYKDNYLYYETAAYDFWPEEKYDHKKDYIYRYKQMQNFIKKYLKKKETMTQDEINWVMYNLRTRDELNFLLSLGADVNCYCDSPDQPLLVFLVQSNFEKSDVVRGLLEKGAKINAIDNFRKTPYYHALKNNYINIINILAEYKYNILNDLYFYKIITPDFANINNINIDLLTDKVKKIKYADDDNRDIVIEIVKSCIED